MNSIKTANTVTTTLPHGQELFIVSQGTGSPVFVLGGPWFGHYYLQQLIDNLAQEFRVIAYDPRGSGQSSSLSENEINLKGHLDDLEDLRRALNVGKLNIVGHSLGAHVSLLYAAAHPGHVASLVLLHPGPPFEQQMMAELQKTFRSRLTPEAQIRLQSLASSTPFQTGDAQTHQAYFETLYLPFFANRTLPAGLDFGFTATTARYAVHAEERLIPEILAQDPASQLAQIQCPTLVVHAEHDLIPEAFSRFLAEGIPNAEFVRVEGLGHFSYLEDPARVMPPILEFLKRVPA